MMYLKKLGVCRILLLPIFLWLLLVSLSGKFVCARPRDDIVPTTNATAAGNEIIIEGASRVTEATLIGSNSTHSVRYKINKLTLKAPPGGINITEMSSSELIKSQIRRLLSHVKLHLLQSTIHFYRSPDFMQLKSALALLAASPLKFIVLILFLRLFGIYKNAKFSLKYSKNKNKNDNSWEKEILKLSRFRERYEEGNDENYEIWKRSVTSFISKLKSKFNSLQFFKLCSSNECKIREEVPSDGTEVKDRVNIKSDIFNSFVTSDILDGNSLPITNNSNKNNYITYLSTDYTPNNDASGDVYFIPRKITNRRKRSASKRKPKGSTVVTNWIPRKYQSEENDDIFQDKITKDFYKKSLLQLTSSGDNFDENPQSLSISKPSEFPNRKPQSPKYEDSPFIIVEDADSSLLPKPPHPSPIFNPVFEQTSFTQDDYSTSHDPVPLYTSKPKPYIKPISTYTDLYSDDYTLQSYPYPQYSHNNNPNQHFWSQNTDWNIYPGISSSSSPNANAPSQNYWGSSGAGTSTPVPPTDTILQFPYPNEKPVVNVTIINDDEEYTYPQQAGPVFIEPVGLSSVDEFPDGKEPQHQNTSLGHDPFTVLVGSSAPEIVLLDDISSNQREPSKPASDGGGSGGGGGAGAIAAGTGIGSGAALAAGTAAAAAVATGLGVGLGVGLGTGLGVGVGTGLGAAASANNGAAASANNGAAASANSGAQPEHALLAGAGSLSSEISTQLATTSIGGDDDDDDYESVMEILSSLFTLTFLKQAIMFSWSVFFPHISFIISSGLSVFSFMFPWLFPYIVDPVLDTMTAMSARYLTDDYRLDGTHSKEDKYVGKGIISKVEIPKKDNESVHVYGEFNVDSGMDIARDADSRQNALLSNKQQTSSQSTSASDMVATDIRTPPKIKSQIAHSHHPASSPGKGEAIPIILDENDQDMLERIQSDNFKYTHSSSSSNTDDSIASVSNGISTWILLNSDSPSTSYLHNKKTASKPPVFESANSNNGTTVTVDSPDQKRTKPNNKNSNSTTSVKKPPKQRPAENVTTTERVERKPIAASIQKVNASIIKKASSSTPAPAHMHITEDSTAYSVVTLQDSKFKNKTPVIVGRVPLKDKIEPLTNTTTPMAMNADVSTTTDKDSSSNNIEKIIRLGTPVVSFPHVPPRQRPSIITQSIVRKQANSTTSRIPQQNDSNSIAANTTTVQEISASQNSSTEMITTITTDETATELSSSDSAGNKKPSSSSQQKKKKKKNKNKKKKRPNKNSTSTTAVVESKISEIDENVTSKVPGLQTTSRPLSTRIYNYLAREVMPNVGVGIVGLMLTAGLAGLLLYPFGGGVPIRRNYYEKPSSSATGPYDYRPGVGEVDNGQPEESVFSQVLAGMNQYGRDQPDAAGSSSSSFNSPHMNYKNPQLKYSNRADYKPMMKVDDYKSPPPSYKMAYKPSAKFDGPTEYKTIYDNDEAADDYKPQITPVKFDEPIEKYENPMIVEYKLDDDNNQNQNEHKKPIEYKQTDTNNNEYKNHVEYKLSDAQDEYKPKYENPAEYKTIDAEEYKTKYETPLEYKNNIKYQPLGDSQNEFKPKYDNIPESNEFKVKYDIVTADNQDEYKIKHETNNNNIEYKQTKIDKYNMNEHKNKPVDNGNSATDRKDGSSSSQETANKYSDLGDVVTGPHESVKFSSFGVEDVKYSTVDKSHSDDSTLVELTSDDVNKQSSDSENNLHLNQFISMNEVSPNSNSNPTAYSTLDSYAAYNNPNEPIQRPIYKSDLNNDRKNHKDKIPDTQEFKVEPQTTNSDNKNSAQQISDHFDRNPIAKQADQPSYSALEGIPKNYRTLDTSITIEDAVLPLNDDFVPISGVPVYKQAEHGPRTMKLRRRKRSSWSENEIDSELPSDINEKPSNTSSSIDLPNKNVDNSTSVKSVIFNGNNNASKSENTSKNTSILNTESDITTEITTSNILNVNTNANDILNNTNNNNNSQNITSDLSTTFPDAGLIQSIFTKNANNLDDTENKDNSTTTISLKLGITNNATTEQNFSTDDCNDCFNIDNIPSATEEPPKQIQPTFSFTSFFRKIIEFKIKLGLEFLRTTTEALSRYVTTVQKRMAETVRNLQKINLQQPTTSERNIEKREKNYLRFRS